MNVGEYGLVELNAVGVRDHSYGTFTLMTRCRTSTNLSLLTMTLMTELYNNDIINNYYQLLVDITVMILTGWHNN